jgi:tape measure domain-containing protein
MCDHAEQLDQARYALEQMWGNGVIDYPALRKLLEHHHQEN